LRLLLGVALVVAVGAGLWIRSLFRGANLQDSVQASSTAAAPAAPDVPPEPAPAPSWAPPVLQYPPVVGYNRGEPPSAAGLAPAAPPATAAADTASPTTSMVSIAPPTEPTRKTTFTNEDLERARGVPGGAPASTPAPAALPVSAPNSARAGASPAVVANVSTTDDAARDEWASRVRDREDDLQKAQAKVRRLAAEVDIKKAEAARATDPDARDRAQQDVMDALDALDKAERKAADKQRDLDDEKDRARAAGVRFER
jgi:hypothetical protein